MSKQIVSPRTTTLATTTTFDMPDHCIVIKHLRHAGDSKRHRDDYIFQIFMGGQQCVAMQNLASPQILDFVIITELMQRIEALPLPTPSIAQTVHWKICECPC